MSTPLHLPTGPHGLNTIDFRETLRKVNLDDTKVFCTDSTERPATYWIALSVGSQQYADAYCTATTAVERNEAIQWMRDMAVVLKGGAE